MQPRDRDVHSGERFAEVASGHLFVFERRGQVAAVHRFDLSGGLSRIDPDRRLPVFPGNDVLQGCPCGGCESGARQNGEQVFQDRLFFHATVFHCSGFIAKIRNFIRSAKPKR